MVFLGMLTNRQDFHRLSARLDGMSSRFDALNAKIDSVSAQLHNDMMMVHSVLRDFEGRLSKLEARP
jgi:division protein CdvB (Snf7/Vps24/ESCRT-III family)